MMAIYQAWTQPLSAMFKANLLFFLPTDIYRPMAFAWYRLMHTLAGMHAAPYKIVSLATVVASIFLTYALARRLSKSRTAATVTALIWCYHGEAVNFYWDTGFEADVLCYFFFVAAALVYVRPRSEDRFPTGGELTACCALGVCAMNAKELAVVLPVFLLLYEWIYHRPNEPWSWRHGLGIVATGLITLALLIGKTLAPHSLMHTNVMYQPEFTWARFMQTSTQFTSDVFLRRDAMTPAMLLALWLVLLAIAWLTRSRTLRFAWLFMMLSPLPVAFIPPRGVHQYSVTFFGWALYAGVLINLAFSWVLRFFHPANPVRTRIYASGALVAGLGLLLYPLWKSYPPGEPVSVSLEAEDNRSTARQLRRLVPTPGGANTDNGVKAMRPGARLMFLDDPVHADRYNLTILVRLLFHDRSIVVHRAKPGAVDIEKPPEPLTSATLASYDHVFDYRGGYFRELRAPWDRSPMPAIVLEWGEPQIFHKDWMPVDRGHPARGGETLIVKGMDLGETLPPVAPGQPFPPSSPYAALVTDVRARFNGTRTEVENKIGWPGETNRYRVDIRLPGRVPRGLSWLDLSANGVTGPGIEVPVR
jgi:hypothetical protein